MIGLVQTGEALRASLAAANEDCTEATSLKGLLSVLLAEQLEAIVLGSGVEEPLKMVTHVYRIDRQLPVVLLANGDAECERLQAALRFAVFIGKDVVCVDEVTGAIEATRQAAERGRLRRQYARIARRLQDNEPARPAAITREQAAAHLLELAPVGILVMDSARRIRSVNGRACAIFGRGERDILDKCLDDFVSEADFAAWLAFLDANPVSDRTLELALRGNEQPVHVEARVIQLQDDAASYLLSLQDVTERVKLEESRAEALARLEHANQVKDEFIATVSHELRTPLNALLGWARMLRAGLPEERRQRALETIERNAMAQAHLIEDLLDMTRIEHARLRLEMQPVWLASTVEDAIDAIRPAVEAKQIELRSVLDDSCRVWGDPRRLQQVAWNLLSNAVKFTSARSGHITVLLTCSGEQVEFSVVDDGQGIHLDFLPFIFEKFRQADGSTSRRQGGLGIGLSIVRQLVEMHGGTVSAHSDGLGRGAAVRVVLPSLHDERPLSVRSSNVAATQAVGTRLRGLRVLVVEDDRDTALLFETVLTDAGAVVRIAHDVPTALRFVAEEPPTVVLSDLGLPEQDGYDFLRSLRSLPHLNRASTPVAAVTAYASPAERKRVLDAGFQMHIVKPVQPTELVDLVSALASMAPP